VANSIRTPRQGVTATSRRIAEAVDNEEWQKFRLSLKGKSTSDKISMLEGYYDNAVDALDEHPDKDNEHEFENIKIRIDNYIKALCRGGQLEAGMTFDHFNDGSIRNHIRK
jgi:hypothetical protein